jgi:hypothetical protein
MATQVIVAESDPVLSGALQYITPAVSLYTLKGEIQSNGQTSNILAISAKGPSAAQAETTANAVARSYVNYVTSPHSLLGQVTANILQPAMSATGTSQAKKGIVYGLIGAVAGVLVGVTVGLAISRGDPRLRERDEIANCIGAPVLASFPVTRPTDPAAWMELLESYAPAPVHALHLRQALRQAQIVGLSPDNGIERGGSSLAVLSLSSDPGALAIGPQLAVFAASLGIPTTLIIGPEQDATITSTLRIACSVPPPASSKRPGNLRVAVADSSDTDAGSGPGLRVIVAVVDSRSPRVAETMPATVTLLGVSAGAATAEQLAGTAASAASDGREIVGILVANPEATDRTSGRIPQLAWSAQHSVSIRLKGMTTEMRR